MATTIEKNANAIQLRKGDSLEASLINALNDVKPLVLGKRSVKNDIDEQMKKWENWADDIDE